jgi:hypothetical protein
MVWDCWQAPEDLVSHGLWKQRWGGVPNFIKEHVNAYFQYSEPLSTCLVWKITRTPLPFVDRNNHLPKQFLSLFYKWKALAHNKSLLPSAKGLYFTFYVEYSYSIFMHQLREHSCLSLCTTLLCFLYAQNIQITFNALLFMIFCLCCFSCCNMVAKFYG